jgi:hypothetical protein
LISPDDGKTKQQDSLSCCEFISAQQGTFRLGGGASTPERKAMVAIAFR